VFGAVVVVVIVFADVGFISELSTASETYSTVSGQTSAEAVTGRPTVQYVDLLLY